MRTLKYFELKNPLTAQLELTSKCTNNCVYCYNPWRYTQKVKESELSFQEFNRIIDELIRSDVFEVVFTGGEPLLRKDILYPSIEKISKRNIDTKINSNLVLLDGEDIKKIKDLSVSGVLTSISSYNKTKHDRICGTNSFDKVINNLEKLIAHDICVGASMVVMKDNKDDVYETGKFLYEKIGLNIFCATPISPCSSIHKDLEITPSDMEKVLDNLIALKNDFGISVDVLEPIPRCIIRDPKKYDYFLRRDCSAGKLTVAISPSGDVRPCTHVSKKYGNLLNECLEDIWKKMNEWRSGAFIPNKCNNCEELDICSTGCREAANVYFHNYKSEDPWTVGYSHIAQKEAFLKTSIIKETDKFIVSPNIKYRKEDGNYILFSPKRYTMAIINKPFFDLISDLNTHLYFSTGQIKNLSNGNEREIEDLFNFLYNQGIVLKLGEVE